MRNLSMLSGTRKRSYAAVMIELGLLKVVAFRGLEILDYRIVPVTQRYFREGLIGNREAVATVVRNAINDMDRGVRAIVATVPGYQNSMWITMLPAARGIDPGVIIPQDASRRMGISADTSLIRWWRLKDELDRRKWLAVSATRRSIAAATDVLARTGLPVRHLELRPFALARAVNQRDAVIISTYADGTDIVIVRNAVPETYSGIYWGSDVVDSATLLNRLAEASARAVAMHNQNSLEEPLGDEAPVFVFGQQIGQEPSVAAEIAAFLQRPAGEVRPPMEHPADLPLQDLMVGVGLALSVA